jgi:transposase
MSTSLLYHGFGIRGYRYVKSQYVDGMVIFHVEQPRERLCCSACGSQDVVLRGRSERLFRHVPIGGKLVWIQLAVPRVGCQSCGCVRRVKVTFADPRRRYTRAFARYVLELSRHMTIKHVAGHLGVSWDTVKEIQRTHLQRHYSRPPLKHLRKLAIDEIATRKGHVYMTIVLDLDSGVVVFVGDGKGADSLLPFWKRLRASGARIQAVAIDMSEAYINAVEEHLPDADLVFDRFHMVRLLGEKLTQLRRELYREAKDLLHKNVLKGTRWLLLKHPENLDESRDEKARLAEALKLNEPLATAYYLKDDLRQLWEQPHPTAARNFVTSWYQRAMDSGIRVMQQFARTLAGRLFGIMNWFRHPISTSPLEGVNNKIKTMKRQAYGFRDQEFFKLKIYALHETKYALIG